MKKPAQSYKENTELKARLAEAQNWWIAIISGAVDAVVTADQKVFTSKARTMPTAFWWRRSAKGGNPGARRTVTYCNNRLAEYARMAPGQVIGCSLWILPAG